jgi:hypothetical protein
MASSSFNDPEKYSMCFVFAKSLFLIIQWPKNPLPCALPLSTAKEGIGEAYRQTRGDGMVR